MTPPSPVKRFDWRNFALRAASALILIPSAVVAVVHGGWLFLLLVAVGAALMGLEWGLISAPAAPTRIGAAVMVAVLSAVFASWLGSVSAAFVLMVFGAAAAALFARRLGLAPIDAAYGVLYIGWPCLVLVWLRQQPDGIAWVVLLFAVAWSSDIVAFLIGNLLKGPRLWPSFSPNKTWSGFIGGVAAGVVAGVLAARGMGMALGPAAAAAVSLIAALATMAGDLWESALKRRFGVKDAGRLIPGHGGLLDRVDGMMFAVIALAVCRLVIQGWRFPWA